MVSQSNHGRDGQHGTTEGRLDRRPSRLCGSLSFRAATCHSEPLPVILSRYLSF